MQAKSSPHHTVKVSPSYTLNVCNYYLQHTYRVQAEPNLCTAELLHSQCLRSSICEVLGNMQLSIRTICSNTMQ